MQSAMKNQRLAVGLMIGQAILFAVENAMIHHIGPRGSPMLLALLRSGAGVTLVGLIGWNTGWNAWPFSTRSTRSRLSLARRLSVNAGSSNNETVWA